MNLFVLIVVEKKINTYRKAISVKGKERKGKGPRWKLKRKIQRLKGKNKIEYPKVPPPAMYVAVECLGD